MSTKVKGDKIKEGSIPLSALSSEVKDKIENAGGGADWNAQAGETGYIENRTHYLYGRSEYTLGKGINKIPNEYKTFIAFGPKVIRVPDFEDNLQIQIMYAPPAYIKYIIGDDGNRYIELIDDYNYFADNTIEFYNDPKTINDVFIPDTVIKTTPQTLSNDDKNQALANLGIENYFRQIKDKCTLHIQYDELSFDSENPNLVTGYSTGLDNLIKDIKSFISNCYYYNEIGQLITEGGKFTCTEMHCNNLNDVHNATGIAISFGTTIFGEANFSTQIQIRYENDELLLFYFEI